MNIMEKAHSLSDVYLIHADDRYSKFIDSNSLKAYINFFSLFYQRILIADSFLVNNKNLIDFILNHGGNEYIDKEIIVPYLRSDIDSLKDLYEKFKINGTLNSDAVYLFNDNYLDKLNRKKSSRWDIDEVSDHFTTQVKQHLSSRFHEIKLPEQEQNVIIEKLHQHSNEYINRKDTINILTSHFDNNVKLMKQLLDEVDIIYNLSLPNINKVTAEYPSVLKEEYKNYSIAKKLLFVEQNIENQLKSDKYETETVLFDYGLLSSLDASQIQIIRSVPSHKKLVNALEGTNSDTSDFAGIFESFNKDVIELLPEILNYKEIKKRKRILKIKTTVYDIGSELLSSFIQLNVHGDIATLATPLLFRGLNYSFRKLVVESDKSIIEDQIHQGRSELRKAITNESIRNHLQHQFGLCSGI